MIFDHTILTFVGLIVIVLLVTGGLNRILLWMDDKDWIMIPNREVVNNASTRFGSALRELQAYVEPARQHEVRQKEEEKLKREEDEAGQGGPHPGD